VRVALWKYDHVTRNQMYGRFIAELDKAFSFRDEMKDDHAFCAGLKQGRSRVGTGGLITPGRGKPRVDEDGAYEANDTQSLRECIH
jgi:hypothetical protein